MREAGRARLSQGVRTRPESRSGRCVGPGGPGLCPAVGPTRGSDVTQRTRAVCGVPAGPPSLPSSSGCLGLPGSAGLGSKVGLVCRSGGPRGDENEAIVILFYLSYYYFI